jgi:hypothetical protein
MKSVLKTAFIASFALSLATAFAWADQPSGDNSGGQQASAPAADHAQDTERNTASVHNDDSAAAPSSNQGDQEGDGASHRASYSFHGNKF